MIKDNTVHEEIYFIKVKANDGQKFINFISTSLNKESLIDNNYEIIKENEFIFFPLKERNKKKSTEFLKNKINNDFDFQIILRKPQKRQKHKYSSIDEALKAIFPNEYKDTISLLIPKSYDIVGDIAIIEFNDADFQKEENIPLIKKKIAQALIQVNKNVKNVYEKMSGIKGVYRLRDFNLLFGTDESETIHKENNCVFKLDIKKTFFSPRLVFERNRLASFKTIKDEIIVDMFAGVGPISIQIAKKNLNLKIYAFDINLDAYNYLIENIELNRVTERVVPYNLDVKALLNPSNKLGILLENNIDRIIMNLPENSFDFLDVASFLIKKSGGIIHFYQISDKPYSIKKVLESLNFNLKLNRLCIEKIIHKRIVKSYSPKSDLVALDLQIRKRDN